MVQASILLRRSRRPVGAAALLLVFEYRHLRLARLPFAGHEAGKPMNKSFAEAAGVLDCAAY